MCGIAISQGEGAVLQGPGHDSHRLRARVHEHQPRGLHRFRKVSHQFDISCRPNYSRKAYVTRSSLTPKEEYDSLNKYVGKFQFVQLQFQNYLGITCTCLFCLKLFPHPIRVARTVE